MAEELNIIHNAAARRFEYHENGQVAYIEYRFQEKSIAFLHTVVPDALGGRGIAAALTVYAFKYAKEHALPVIVYCPYIQAYLKKHPELNEQLDRSFHSNI